MPVEGSAVFGAENIIPYVPSDRSTPVGLIGGGGECPIDQKSASVHTVWRDKATGDIEIVRGALATYIVCQHASQVTQL